MNSYNVLHSVVLFPTIIILTVLVIAFEIWMIVDAITNDNISNTAKAWWIVGMLLVHPFVAIAYYFTDHRKR